MVDFRGQVVLDTYVCPTMPVTDYRTATTGIEVAHLSPGWFWILDEAETCG